MNSPEMHDTNLDGQLALSYPFLWTEDIESFAYPLDENGIPRVYIDDTWGLRYNPITIAQFGLHNLTRYALTHEASLLTIARQQAQWLVTNVQHWRNKALVWVNDYDLTFYGPRAPWISAMAQGEAISLLLRMQRIQPDSLMRDITQKAVHPFFYSVAEGGVATTFPDGSPSFEEYPTSPPSQVLNGHIFALIGLYEFAKFWQDNAALALFRDAVVGLKNNLHRYDTGFWNRYDLHPTHRLASAMYVRVHVQLLEILYTLTDDPFFLDTAKRWERYLHRVGGRLRWLAYKCVEKVRLANRQKRKEV